MTTGWVVLIQSVQTVLAAWHPRASGGGRLPALVLGSVEIAAAVLFLVPRTLALGAIGLIAVFAIAFVAHAFRGQVTLPLLVYAAAVYVVMTQRAETAP
ncbi:MAG TPA: hypothetical protein VFB67_11765 [Candidatus Polarisedimenticolaceae bacterium]|nr:hypothetical protein [Candidatus Polarisedimenticolaceae bacterium]